MKNEILLSFILPVYNVEKFISQCLETLLLQNIPKENYEIICIDDGSTDNSIEKIKQFQAKENNITIFSQKNSGVSAARNKGIKLARGTYVWFVDPDDFIATNILKDIINLMTEVDSDLFQMNFHTCKEDDFLLKDTIIEAEGIKKNNIDSKASGCAYVIKKSLLITNKIKWSESLAYGEDYLFAFQINSLANRKLSTECKLYYYRQRNGSAMTDINKRKYVESMMTLSDCYKNLYDDFENSPYNSQKWKNNLYARRNLAIRASIIHFVNCKMKRQEIYEYVLKVNDSDFFQSNEKLQFSKNMKMNIYNLYVFTITRRGIFVLISKIKLLLA